MPMISCLKKYFLCWPLAVTVPLLAAAFGMSSFFTGTDTFWFAPPLVCVFMIVAMTFLPGFSGGWRVPRTATAALAALFGIYVAVSAFWSNAPYISILFAFVVGTMPLLFLTLVSMSDPGRAVRAHVAALFIVLCGLAVWAWIQFFFLYEQYGPRIRHPMLSPNNLASLFMIGLFIALALYFRARDKAAALAAYPAVLLLMMALVLTQSRGGMIFTLAAALVMLAVLWRVARMRWRRVLAVAGTALFSLHIVNQFSSGYLGRNIGDLAVATQLNSLNDRLALYSSSLEMLRDHFWGGIGLGTFYFTYPAYRDPIDFSDGFFTHMDPLQYGLEMGILAPVLFYAVLVAVLWRTIRAMRAAPAGSPVRVEIMAAFCGMLAVTMHTHIDFHLYVLVSLIAMGVAMAWWYIATEEALGEARPVIVPPRGPVWLWRGGVIVALLMLLSWPVRAAWTTVDFPPVRQAMDDGRLAEAEEGLMRISRYAQASHYRLYQYWGRLGTQKLNTQRAEMSREEAQAVFDAADKAFALAQRYNRDFTGIAADRAKLYYVAQGWLIADGYERATAMLEHVVAANPLDWDARIGLANVYQEQGYFAKALRVMERGRTEWPMPLGPLGLRLMIIEAEIHLKMGNRAGYDAMLRRARDYAVQHGMVVAP